ncbi:MAG: sodium:calcium antiporter, partial [Parvularculaceae bacterium]|nr:sodium:calcium antiporter [Parvularculaceae bacterium]
NIANILLVLGLPAVLAPIALNVERLKRHGLALAGATLLFCALIYRSGGVGLFEACLFTVGMLGYFALMLREARNGESDLTAEAAELAPTKPRFPPTMLMLIAGLIGLPVGATLLVDNGGALAASLGVRDEIIGLTVVAFGTSLPELATVLAAAARKEMGVVAGSIIGSNIFNMLFVGSAAGFVGKSQFTEAALQVDVPMMIAATALITVLIMTKTNIGRITGIAMTAVYVGYIIFLGAAGLA